MAKGRLAIVQKMLEAGGQSPARIADFMQVAGGDAALATRLVNAAESGDYRSILKAMSEHQWGRSPAVPVPEAPAPTGSRSPIPFEQRVVNDPEIRRTIEDAGVPPALRAGVDAGDLQAILESYRNAANAEDSIRTLRKPPDQVAAESIAGQFDRATGAAPERQMELPLGDEPTGLVSYGVRGPGVPGGVSGPGVPVSAGTDLIPAPPLRVGGQTRAMSIPQRGLTVVDEGVDPALQRFFDSTDSSPRSRAAFHAKNAAAGIDGRRAAAAASAVAGLGGAAYLVSQGGKDLTDAAAEAGVHRAVMDPLGTAVARDPLGTKLARDPLSLFTQDGSAVESGGEADLAAETSPPPAVAATADVPEPTVVQAPQDYSLQARKLIDRLNDMRRAAGGEVPEAPAMMKEINRLMALGNQTRRATAVAAPQDDAGRLYQQAQKLIDQVNQMYRQGMTPNSPQVQRVMAQVRQLQSQGDAIRNRRAG